MGLSANLIYCKNRISVMKNIVQNIIKILLIISLIVSLIALSIQSPHFSMLFDCVILFFFFSLLQIDILIKNKLFNKIGIVISILYIFFYSVSLLSNNPEFGFLTLLNLLGMEFSAWSILRLFSVIGSAIVVGTLSISNITNENKNFNNWFIASTILLLILNFIFGLYVSLEYVSLSPSELIIWFVGILTFSILTPAQFLKYIQDFNKQ